MTNGYIWTIGCTVTYVNTILAIQPSQYWKVNCFWAVLLIANRTYASLTIANWITSRNQFLCVVSGWKVHHKCYNYRWTVNGFMYHRACIRRGIVRYNIYFRRGKKTTLNSGFLDAVQATRNLSLTNYCRFHFRQFSIMGLFSSSLTRFYSCARAVITAWPWRRWLLLLLQLLFSSIHKTQKKTHKYMHRCDKTSWIWMAVNPFLINFVCCCFSHRV